MVTLVKRCPGDGEDRPAHTAAQDKFGKCDTRNDGLQPYCRSCFAARQRRWKRANVEKVREAKRDYRQRMRAER